MTWHVNRMIFRLLRLQQVASNNFMKYKVSCSFAQYLRVRLSNVGAKHFAWLVLDVTPTSPFERHQLCSSVTISESQRIILRHGEIMPGTRALKVTQFNRYNPRDSSRSNFKVTLQL